jgi:hypothetical protein
VSVWSRNITLLRRFCKAPVMGRSLELLPKLYFIDLAVTKYNYPVGVGWPIPL